VFDFWVPPRAIQLFDGPAKDISDLWRILGRPVKDGGYIAGTIIKPKLGLRPEPFAEAAYQFWLGVEGSPEGRCTGECAGGDCSKDHGNDPHRWRVLPARRLRPEDAGRSSPCFSRHPP
jgi:hypothetical protein